jgi:hypothetical protein
MVHPMTTGSQIASHDAWLAEMQKEPSAELAQVERSASQRGRLWTIASRLGGLARRLGARSWPEAPVVPEVPVQANGASG